jgi:RES domain-containing protein
MRSWRIAIEEAALDRSCEGAKKNGGHWHHPGVGALYSAMTPELAVLEKFVHLEPDEQPLVLVAIDLPDAPELGWDVPTNLLPRGWEEMPASVSAAAFGSAFLARGSHLYMRVPSTIIGEGVNLVINPCHPAFDEVGMTVVRPFSFDPRMFKRG